VTEESVYGKAGLLYRRGEIAAAAAGKLPTLVSIEDLRGDLHMHTTASDGANSIEQMANAAMARGYEYIAITDHSQSLKITNGLDPKRLRAHHKAIDKLNARLNGITILKSAEVDILEHGRLDYPNSVLKNFDLTICSIHSRFVLDKRAQTQWLMRAMDNPHFTILGHATGRLLLKRGGYEIDFEQVLEHALACRCFFEINCSPDRLDLSDEHANSNVSARPRKWACRAIKSRALRATVELSLATSLHSIQMHC
jgi:DNA polymerase (family X)